MQTRYRKYGDTCTLFVNLQKSAEFSNLPAGPANRVNSRFFWRLANKVHVSPLVPVAVLHGPRIFNRQFEPMETAGEVSQNVSHMAHFDHFR